MTYAGLADYVTKAVINASGRLDDDTPLSEHLRLIEVVTEMSDRLTEEQLAAIADAIPYEGEVPAWHEPTTEEGLTLQDVGDALADLSESVSAQAEAQEITDDAIAELSEIVSGLVPQE